MRTPRTFIVSLVLLRAAAAQIPEDVLRASIVGVRYPPLGEQARIQGDVRLDVRSGMVTLVSGHPILAEIAVKNARTFGSIHGETNLEVTYHFVLADTSQVPTSVTIKRGDAFERAILRMFGRTTEKVIVEYRCEEGIPRPNDLRIAGEIVEVWIFGKSRCIQTNTAALAAKL